MMNAQCFRFLVIFVILAETTGIAKEDASISVQSVMDFASLQKFAQGLAKKPYEPAVVDLDPFYLGLKYDDHRQIRFREERALYGDGEQTFRMEFFHLGWMFKKPVVFSELTADGANPVPFNAEWFQYGEVVPPAGSKPPEGYAGFRVLAPDSLAQRRFEFLVFMGASYFRAVTTELGYGISARGVAVNTIGGEPEEFPDFTHFWLKPPAKGDDYFTCMALLNGPSVTGAFEFSAMPGKTTTMFVKATLYVRQPVKMLGLAPFSSMFWYGENSHPKPYDFRPEVHDSDGLQIEMVDGPSIWRPLDVGRDMRLSMFSVEKLKGFGLAQRDRDFNHYQDLEANYHRRPSVWVEPIKGFGSGKVVLVELATGEETWDNIVVFWQPDQTPTSPDTPLDVEYRIDWAEERVPGFFAKVLATRRGFVMDSADHLYVVDFSNGLIDPAPEPGWMPEIEVKIAGQSDAKIVDARVMKNPETGGWRAFFRVSVPENIQLMELSCELKHEEKVFSERWLYQWRR